MTLSAFQLGVYIVSDQTFIVVEIVAINIMQAKLISKTKEKKTIYIVQSMFNIL